MRLPPFNLEAEMGVLGSLILDPDRVHEVAPVLRADDFYRDDHALAYRAILTVTEAGRPVSLVAVYEELARSPRFRGAELEINPLLVEWIESIPHAAHAAYYADLVRQKAVARDVIAAAEEVLQAAYGNDYTGEDLAEIAERAMFAVGDRRVSHRVKTLAEAARASMARLDARLAGVRPGLPTGFADFDAMVGGLQPGQLVVLGARPSIGKTAFALNVADFIATDSDRTATLFVSLEMTDEELGDRALCGRAQVDGAAFANPAMLVGDDWESLRRALARCEESRLFIDDAPSQAITHIAAMARRYRARERIGLLVIDYLQLVDPDEAPRHVGRQEQVAMMTRGLKNLAKSLGIPVLLLCQLNREVEKREGKRPQLSDLRESGAIEQDANMVLFLHRPEFYDKNDRPGEADLIIAKNRGGPTGTIKLAFRKSTTTFSSWNEPLRDGHEYAGF